MADNTQPGSFGSRNPLEDAKELRQTADDLSQMGASISNIAGNALAGLGSVKKIATETASTFQSMSDILTQQVRTAKDYEKLKQAEKDLAKSMIRIEVERSILMEKVKNATEAQKRNYIKGLEVLLDMEETIRASEKHTKGIADQAKRIVDAGGIFANMADTLQKIPIIGGFLAKPFELAAKHATKAAEQGAGPLQAGLMGAWKAAQLLVFQLGPAMLLKSLIDASDRLGKINQSLGVGLDGAREISKSYQQIADADRRLTTDKLVDAMSKYNDELGISVALDGERARSFQLNTEYLGATAQAAAKVDVLSRSIGQGSEEFASNLAQSTVQAGKSAGVHMTLKNVMNEIGKMTATTLLNLRRKPEALAQAVIQAQKLGVTFDQLRSISSSLLDFETSIANELEAEVLTGKQLNLERARAAALTGNDLDLMREIGNQIGTLTEFEKMNVIQREAAAKAFGLQADQLGDILLKQDMIKNVGKEAEKASIEQLKAAARYAEENKIGQKEALVEIQRQESIGKRFQDLILKVQGKIVDFAERYEGKIRSTIESIQKFLDGGTIANILKYATMFVAGGTILSMARNILGATPMTAMWVRMVGAPGSTAFNPNFAQGSMLSKNIPGGANYSQAMAMSRGGAYGLSRNMGGALGARAAGGFGLAGMAIQVGGNHFADKFEESGNMGAAQGTDLVSGGLQGAAYGAALGSIVPGIGTAAGAIIGGAIGLISGGVEAANRRAESEAEERRKREEEKAAKEAKQETYQEEMMRLMRRGAENRASIYFDTNRVSNSLLLNTPAV